MGWMQLRLETTSEIHASRKVAWSLPVQFGLLSCDLWIKLLDLRPLPQRGAAVSYNLPSVGSGRSVVKFKILISSGSPMKPASGPHQVSWETGRPVVVVEVPCVTTSQRRRKLPHRQVPNISLRQLTSAQIWDEWIKKLARALIDGKVPNRTTIEFT